MLYQQTGFRCERRGFVPREANDSLLP
jgi:hypothetical protein